MIEPFVWRGIAFDWVSHRGAHAGRVKVEQTILWFFLKEDLRQPSSHQAWVEWEGGYTTPSVMAERVDALETARLMLLDEAKWYLERLLERFA